MDESCRIFLEYLKTGKLGPIVQGMALDDVLNVLGEPTDETTPTPRHKGSGVLKYDSCELGIGERKVDYIALSFNGYVEAKLPGALGRAVVPVNRHASMEELRVFLSLHEIKAPNNENAFGSVIENPNESEIENRIWEMRLSDYAWAYFDADGLYEIIATDRSVPPGPLGRR